MKVSATVWCWQMLTRTTVSYLSKRHHTLYDFYLPSPTAWNRIGSTCSDHKWRPNHKYYWLNYRNLCPCPKWSLYIHKFTLATENLNSRVKFWIHSFLLWAELVSCFEHILDVLCSCPGPSGDGAVPWSGPFLWEEWAVGSGLRHVSPGDSCTVWRAGGHRSLGSVLSAAAPSHPAWHGAGGTTQFIFPLLFFTLLCMHLWILTLVCCWQDNAGNRMKGFKYLLQAAEAGDRFSMTTVARAFDTGLNLSADRSVRVIF